MIQKQPHHLSCTDLNRRAVPKAIKLSVKGTRVIIRYRWHVCASLFVLSFYCLERRCPADPGTATHTLSSSVFFFFFSFLSFRLRTPWNGNESSGHEEQLWRKMEISGELCRLGGRSDRGVSGIYSTDRKSLVESKTTVTDVINCLYYNDIKSEGL